MGCRKKDVCKGGNKKKNLPLNLRFFFFGPRCHAYYLNDPPTASGLPKSIQTFSPRANNWMKLIIPSKWLNRVFVRTSSVLGAEKGSLPIPETKQAPLLPAKLRPRALVQSALASPTPGGRSVAQPPSPHHSLHASPTGRSDSASRSRPLRPRSTTLLSAALGSRLSSRGLPSDAVLPRVPPVPSPAPAAGGPLAPCDVPAVLLALPRLVAPHQGGGRRRDGVPRQRRRRPRRLERRRRLLWGPALLPARREEGGPRHARHALGKYPFSLLGVPNAGGQFTPTREGSAPTPDPNKLHFVEGGKKLSCRLTKRTNTAIFSTSLM